MGFLLPIALCQAKHCGEGIYPRWGAQRRRFFCILKKGLLRSPAGINPLATDQFSSPQINPPTTETNRRNIV